MIKFLVDVLQIAIALRILYRLGKWLLHRKKRKGKSMLGKVWMLVSRRIHYRLNTALKKQKEALYPDRTSDGKVVPLRKMN